MAGKKINITESAFMKKASMRAQKEHAEATGFLKNNTIADINVNDVKPSPYNQDMPMNDVERYAREIKETGYIEPIVVYKKHDGETTYDLVSGHQRLAAVKLNGQSTIPAHLIDYTDDPVEQFKHHHLANESREKDVFYYLNEIKQAETALTNKGLEPEIGKVAELCSIDRRTVWMYKTYDTKVSPSMKELHIQQLLGLSTVIKAASLPIESQEALAEFLKTNPEYQDEDGKITISRNDFGELLKMFKGGDLTIKSEDKPSEEDASEKQTSPKTSPFHLKMRRSAKSYLSKLMEATENDRDVVIEQVETLEKTIRELKEKFHID